MAAASKIVFFLLFALAIAGMVLGRPQDLPETSRPARRQAATPDDDSKETDKHDLKTANSYGLGYGYGYGFGYPYGYYGLYGLGYGYGYGYPYYGYGGYGYPFYG